MQWDHHAKDVSSVHDTVLWSTLSATPLAVRPPMPTLAPLLPLWSTPEFAPRLCAALAEWPAEALLLVRAMARGSALGPSPHQVTWLAGEALEGRYRVRVGVFFTSIIAGCNCADDPTPVEEQSEYTTLQLTIDPLSGEVAVALED